MKNPKVSVIMPVYNSEPFLEEAVESILNQSFVDFELIAINDASTDASLEILTKYKNNDPRVKLINREKNKGFIYNLNDAIEISKGEYIARMDSDDISILDRFEKQVNFLDSNKDIDIVGGYVKEMGTGKRFLYPTKPDEVENFLLVGTPFGHPVVMIRKSVLINHNLRYSKDFYVAQDFELWSRLLSVSKGANIPEDLLFWRKHENQRSERKKNEKLYNSYIISKRRMESAYPEIDDTTFMKNIITSKEESSFEEVKETISNCKKLINKIPNEHEVLIYKFSKKVYMYLRKNNKFGYKIYKLYLANTWIKKSRTPLLSRIKFILLSVINSFNG